MHSVFLYYAIDAGLDMAIINAGALPVYTDIAEDLRVRVEDVILNRRPDATERLLEVAEDYRDSGPAAETEPAACRTGNARPRVEYPPLHAIDAFAVAEAKH